MARKEESYSPFAPVSQAGSLRNLTGSWRYLRPRYEEKPAPCTAACPAGEPVEAWIGLLEEDVRGFRSLRKERGDQAVAEWNQDHHHGHGGNQCRLTMWRGHL